MGILACAREQSPGHFKGIEEGKLYSRTGDLVCTKAQPVHLDGMSRDSGGLIMKRVVCKDGIPGGRQKERVGESNGIDTAMTSEDDIATPIRSKEGRCLDASQRNKKGGKVHMWNCDTNNKNQDWVYTASTGQIKSKDGKCLDASQRNKKGGKVHMWNCDTNNKNQQWSYETSGVVKSKDGKCLDASQRNKNGGKVHMWDCSSSNKNQQWVVHQNTNTCSGSAKDYIEAEPENQKKLPSHCYTFKTAVCVKVSA